MCVKFNQFETHSFQICQHCTRATVLEAKPRPTHKGQVSFSKRLSLIGIKERMSLNWRGEMKRSRKEMGRHYIIFLGSVMLGIMQAKQQ